MNFGDCVHPIAKNFEDLLRLLLSCEKLDIDFECIGMQQLEHYENYYCTPKDAVIIGSAGVDGIHYCTIPEFGEKIFILRNSTVGRYLSSGNCF